jgi:hypothetical protein
MGDNIEFKGDIITLDSLNGTNIMGTLYLNNINVNTVLENAPPNLDELKEIAANLINIPVVYFNKVTNNTQNVTGDVKFNNFNESTSSTTGAVVVSGGMGVAKNLNVDGDITGNKNLVIRGNLNIEGDTVYANVVNLKVEDRLITLNSNGPSGSASGCGIEFEEGNVIVGSILMNSTSNGYVMTAPNASNGSATIPLEAGLQTKAIMNQSASVQTINGDLKARTIESTVSNGTSPFVVVSTTEVTNLRSATATTLATARNIGNVSFDGSADIDLPGVNIEGNQNTTGNAATATSAAACSGNAATATTAGAITFVTIPTNQYAPGQAGQMAVDSENGLLYVCFATGSASNSIPANVRWLKFDDISF